VAATTHNCIFRLDSKGDKAPNSRNDRRKKNELRENLLLQSTRKIEGQWGGVVLLMKEGPFLRVVGRIGGCWKGGLGCGGGGGGCLGCNSFRIAENYTCALLNPAVDSETVNRPSTRTDWKRKSASNRKRKPFRRK
jgi:hypothetical protein